MRHWHHLSARSLRYSGMSRRSPVRKVVVPTFRSSYTISAITFYELRKAMGISKFMILVPLFDLKSLGSFRRLRCRDFKSAALACGHGTVEPDTITARCLGTSHHKTGAPVAPLGNGPDERTLSLGWSGHERVDPHGTPAIFRRLRAMLGLAKRESPSGGIGRRARLKIEFRKECWFDSGQGHQPRYRLGTLNSDFGNRVDWFMN